MCIHVRSYYIRNLCVGAHEKLGEMRQYEILVREFQILVREDYILVRGC